MFWPLLLITIIIIAVAFAAIDIKMFVKKGGQFERHCENEGTSNCICGGKGGVVVIRYQIERTGSALILK